MSIPGVEIYHCHDEYGTISVFENGALRYLAFGEDAQQSCIDTLSPAILHYEYTQAMMLALLYKPKPSHVTLLGLGAGSFIHSLRQYNENIVLNAVELRQQVVDVAKEWFDLPSYTELSLHIHDACEYMANAPQKSDLIFADIYNGDGMIESQLSPDFLSDCFNNLNSEGILVLNLWDQGGGSHPQAIQRIRDNFGGHCMTCLIEDGNLIAYAFKDGLPQINSRRLQPLAKQLAKKLNIPVHKLLPRLTVV